MNTSPPQYPTIILGFMWFSRFLCAAVALFVLALALGEIHDAAAKRILPDLTGPVDPYVVDPPASRASEDSLLWFATFTPAPGEKREITTEFVPEQSGQVFEMYAADVRDSFAPQKVEMFDAWGDLLASATVPPGEGWRSVRLETPVSIIAGEKYSLIVSTMPQGNRIAAHDDAPCADDEESL